MSLILGLLLAGTAAQAAENVMSDPIGDAARFQAPPGWRRESGAFGADPFVSFSSGSLRLRVQLFGAKGSRYATGKAFLAGPEAKGDEGAPRSRLVKAGTRKVRVYERSYEAALGSPGEPPGAMASVEERFALVPAGKRFFILSYTRRSEAPTLEPFDLAPWTAFLKSFRLR